MGKGLVLDRDGFIDANKVYLEYFCKKKDLIINLIRQYKSSGKKVALWGAGKKGSALLEAIDPSNEFVICVFDKDKNKTGMRLKTGHEIKDYNKFMADVVLVANSVFELEVVHTLEKINPEINIINVDSIILGDLEEINILYKNKPDISKNKSNKICAVVVLYNPDESVIKNICSYSHELDKVFLYDNSTLKNIEVMNKLKEIEGVVFLGGNGNAGLPVAFNETAEIARKNGYTWMVTFDQDSVAENGMIKSMREYADSDACDNKVAIIAPVVNEIDYSKVVQKSYYTYFDKVIQSGAMHNLQIMEKINGYDENMFIDEVDNEYCTRCIVNGYKILKLNNALLMHNQQDEKVIKKFVDGTTVFINKFSPDRYYYRYRNALYCYYKYKYIYPLYALDCKNTIRKMNLQLKYDDNFRENNKAVKQAIKDYENGIFGRRVNFG